MSSYGQAVVTGLVGLATIWLAIELLRSRKRIGVSRIVQVAERVPGEARQRSRAAWPPGREVLCGWLFYVGRNLGRDASRGTLARRCVRGERKGEDKSRRRRADSLRVSFNESAIGSLKCVHRLSGS